MDNSLYLLIFVPVAGFAIYCLAKHWLNIHRHRFCPRCRSKMKMVWNRRDIDPKKEHTRIGRVYYISGTAWEYNSALRCSKCGYEVKL